MIRCAVKSREVGAEQFDGSPASAKSILGWAFPAVRAAYDKAGVFAGRLILEGIDGDLLVDAGQWLVQSGSQVLAFDAEQFARTFERVIG